VAVRRQEVEGGVRPGLGNKPIPEGAGRGCQKRIPGEDASREFQQRTPGEMSGSREPEVGKRGCVGFFKAVSTICLKR